MKNSEENPDRKNIRREKIKKKSTDKSFFVDKEREEQDHFQKKELKKIKKSLEDEEWEDWDRYYNH